MKVITKRASENYYSPENRARRRKQRRVRRSIKDLLILALFVLALSMLVGVNKDSYGKDKVEEQQEVEEAIVEEPVTYESEKDFIARISIEDNFDYTVEYFDVNYNPELEAMVQRMLDAMNADQPVRYADEVLPPVDELPSVSETTQSWTEEDYKYLVMVLTGECQTFSYENQIKVGSVVLNRRASTKYFKNQNTIKDVCLAPGQYSCFRDGGTAYRTPTETTIKAALFLLENGSQLPANVLFQAQFKQGDGVYEQIGNTYLCYKN